MSTLKSRASSNSEAGWRFANALPATLVVLVLLVAPLAWLFMLSFTGAQGGWTLHNYRALFDDAAYAKSFYLTVWLSSITTVVCLLAGYTLAYGMTFMPRWAATLTLAAVALPFWTSVLVRTYAWLVLLQNRGLVNNALIEANLIDTPLRMMHNQFGALIGMVHIMLPFMVFPLHAAIQKVDPDYLRASAAMGASPTYTFWKVFFPQTLAGVVAGCALVFVLSLGFYVTPALLGGGKTIVMSIFIEHEVTNSMNWGPASAAAMIFVAVVFLVFAATSRFVALERIFNKG